MTNRLSSSQLISCPCCNLPTISCRGAYEICEECGWEDDPVQLADPDYAGGANVMSLNDAQRKWLASRKSVSGY